MVAAAVDVAAACGELVVNMVGVAGDGSQDASAAPGVVESCSGGQPSGKHCFALLQLAVVAADSEAAASFLFLE